MSDCACTVEDESFTFNHYFYKHLQWKHNGNKVNIPTLQPKQNEKQNEKQEWKEFKTNKQTKNSPTKNTSKKVGTMYKM